LPEHVPVTTSVTTARPSRWQTPLGVYQFHRIKPDLFYGYRLLDLGAGQQAFVATPEKALLDLIYLQPGLLYELGLSPHRDQVLAVKFEAGHLVWSDAG
jgi:hypothetical protein